MAVEGAKEWMVVERKECGNFALGHWQYLYLLPKKDVQFPQ